MRGLSPRASLSGHRAFLLALAVGIVVRCLAMAAYWPAFVISDGPTYLAISRRLVPSTVHVIGYPVVLRVLSWATDGVWLVAGVQHVLGLVTATLIYALLRRRGCSPRLATLASLPVLLDGMQLVLEHQVLSDVLYQLLLTVAVLLFLWRPRPSTLAVALGALVLGLSVLVRVGGQPVVLPAVILVVLVGRGWRTKLVHAVLVAVVFAVPLLAYAGWYDAHHGAFALTQSGGRALYMRTTSFVDCSRLSLPSYEQPLCPPEPLGRRRDPTWYGWHDPGETYGRSGLPGGTTADEAMRDFADRAIRSQPAAYARVVGRDFLLAFDWRRGNRFGYDTAFKWRFDGWYHYQPSAFTGPAYLQHGGVLPRTTGPLAVLMSGYGRVVYLAGPIMLLLLLLALAGLLHRRRDGGPDQRPALFLLLTLGVGLVLVPDVTAQFVWRYTLPMLTLVPPAAALAWVQLRGPRPGDPGDAQNGLPEGRDEAALEHPGRRDHESVIDRDQPGIR